MRIETITPADMETITMKQTKAGTEESSDIKQIEDPLMYSKEK